MNNMKQSWAKAGLIAMLLTGAASSLVMAEDAPATGDTNKDTDTTTTKTPPTTGTDTTSANPGTAIPGAPAPKTPPVASRFGVKPPKGTAGGPPTGAAYDEMGVNAEGAMLLRTLVEEKSEIQQLNAQQASLMKMGGRQNLRLAALLGRMSREHQAAGPKLMALIKNSDADPQLAIVRHTPVLGTQMQMLDADHKDHVTAVVNSQSRWNTSQSAANKAFYHKRSNLARKHIRQMMPYMKGHMQMDMGG